MDDDKIARINIKTTADADGIVEAIRKFAADNGKKFPTHHCPGCQCPTDPPPKAA